MSDEPRCCVSNASSNAWAELKRLCEGGHWTMGIPARPGIDSDLIIADALQEGDDAQIALRALRERIRALCDEADAQRKYWADHSTVPLFRDGPKAVLTSAIRAALGEPSPPTQDGNE